MKGDDVVDKSEKENPVPEAPLTLAAIHKLLNAMKANVVDEVSSQIHTKIGTSSSSTIPVELDNDKDDGAKSKEKPFGTVVPPPSYLTQVQPTHPHINTQSAPPPKLDSSLFINWRNSMESYVRSSSIQLWRIIKHGFKPSDPTNLSPQEVIDEQLDALVHYLIERAMTEEDVDQVHAFKSTKEAWDYLENLYEGNLGI